MFFYKIKSLIKGQIYFFSAQKKDILIYDALSLKIVSKIFLQKILEFYIQEKKK